MPIAENAIPYPTQCSDDANIYYEHRVFSNSVNRDIANLQVTEDGFLVTIHRNHLNQFIEIRNSAGDGIGWVLIDTLTTTDPLELSGPDVLPQPVVEAVLPDQQANEAVLPDENAIAALPQAAIEEALSGQSENEAVLPRLQDPPANPLQVQITGFTFRSTDVSNSEENLSENPTSEQV
ncbi:uncharacterized protein LOC100179551 [Ciona intestinalis]